MELGDPAARVEHSRQDVVLGQLNANLTELIEAVEPGGLEPPAVAA